MKKIIFLVVALFAASTMFSQGIIFGVKAGVNLATLNSNISEFNDHVSMRTAFHVGGVADVGITDRFSIQPELIYSSVGAKSDADGGDFDIITDYLSIPFLAKYNVANGFSILVGPQAGFLLNAKIKGEDEELDFKDDMESIDFGLGFGLAYKLNTGLSFDARYVLGLSNTWTDTGDDTVKNNVIQFSIGYMFQ